MSGHYVDRSEIEYTYPEIVPEWDKWLDDNLDPGHYDAGKWWNPETKQMERYCNTFMPEYLWDKIFPVRIFPDA